MIMNIIMVSIERYNCPSNSDIDDTIKSIKKIDIGKLYSEIVPQIGEIIRFKNINYVVKHIIRNIEETPETFTIQVTEYNEYRVRSSGSNSWEERIPLCIDIV